MSVFNVDDNGNILVTNGHFTLKEDAEEIRLLILHKTKLWYGEWFLERTKGIRYKTRILTKGTDTNLIKAEFKRAIIGTKGVVGIQEFALMQDTTTREAFLTAKILTNQGVITLNEVLNGA